MTPPSDNPVLEVVYSAYDAYANTQTATEALEIVQEGLSRFPDSGILISTYAFYLGLSGNFSEALEWIDKAIAVEPTNVDYWFLKGQYLSRLGQTHAAREWFQKVVAERLDPLAQRELDVLDNCAD